MADFGKRQAGEKRIFVLNRTYQSERVRPLMEVQRVGFPKEIVGRLRFRRYNEGSRYDGSLHSRA